MVTDTETCSLTDHGIRYSNRYSLTDHGLRYSNMQFKRHATAADKEACCLNRNLGHRYSSGVQFKQTKTTDTTTVCSAN